MNNAHNLTPPERSASEDMVSAMIDAARKHGVDLMGIDYPAIAVREAIANWLVASRQFQPIRTAIRSHSSERVTR